MRFLNPKTDYAFKKIFGSKESKEILISFLNAIVYKDQEIILDLEILNPYLPGTTFGLKDTYLDVKARLNNNTTVLIEMQVLNRYAFDKRVLYNACKAYSNQLDSGERYVLLQPVIALTIVDFILFKNIPDVITYFAFQELTHKVIYNDELQLIFVELPKFKKTLTELVTLSEKWMYFLKNAPELKEKPQMMKENQALNQALEIANLGALSLEELDDIQKRAMWLTDQENISVFAKEEGLKQGMEKGLQQGKIEGLQQGKIELILNLLSLKLGQIPLKISDKIQTLSEIQIESLTKEIFTIETFGDLENFIDNF